MLLVDVVKYPIASKIVRKLGNILEVMDYQLIILDENEDNYGEKIENFLRLIQTEIECKAVLSCNAAVTIEIIGRIECPYFIYLEDLVLLKDYVFNSNTVVISSKQSDTDYIKQRCRQIKHFLYLPLTMEEDQEWTQAAAEICFSLEEIIAIERGQTSTLKLFIQRALESQELAQAEELIHQYKEKCPADLDVIAMQTIFELYSGNLDYALNYALEGIRRYPCSGELHYNLGNVYEAREEWFWAWFAYERAHFIFVETNKSRKSKKNNLEDIITYCKDQYNKHPDTDHHISAEELENNNFGLFDAAFRTKNKNIFGTYYWESETEKKYLAVFGNNVSERVFNDTLDLIHIKGEFVKVTEGTEFEIPCEQADVLLPIAVRDDHTYHGIISKDGQEQVIIKQPYRRHFNYYRIPSHTKVYSSGTSYYGRPIPLRQEKDKKKLVLNLFVDGLAQCILDGKNFEKIMPYTAKFFGKGTVCTRAYSASEWTYPSIANYVTGLDTTHHMMYHHTLDSALPKEYPLLAEYFHEKGYFTSKMDGNWRDAPAYGYTRGYDQFVYQNGGLAFGANQIVGEIIDHLEAFKETNQFFWTCIADLHDISDGFDMPNSVQSKLNINSCSADEMGETSVKQSYSENKCIAYVQMAHRIDMLLNVIYQYVENNYKDEDILVTLFADHGQGFLIQPKGHFCSEGRARVAFMLRGGNVEQQVCDEVISTCDYIQIMCKLANIQMKNIKIDGVLPKAFGGNGREYAIMESIHPGDPYYAAIYAKDCIFYFENSFPVQADGRFYLKQCEIRLTDLEGRQLDSNDERYQKYLSIIMEHIAPLCIYD